jgi:hypothetical protein
LPLSASVGALATASPPTDPAARAAVEFFVAELLRSRGDEISALHVFPPHVELTSDVIDRADWPTRVRNALTFQGLKDNPTKLARVTYGQLFGVRNLGMKSVIEIGLWADEVSGHPQSVDQPVQGCPSLEDRDLESLRSLAHAEWADLIFHSDPRFSDLVPNNGESVSLAGLAEALLLSVGATPGPSQLQFPFAVPFSAGYPRSMLEPRRWTPCHWRISCPIISNEYRISGALGSGRFWPDWGGQERPPSRWKKQESYLTSRAKESVSLKTRFEGNSQPLPL